MLEIERKFLVKTLPDLRGFVFRKIEQGYVIVAKEDTEMRIRNEEGIFTQTVKQGTGLTRMEAEMVITADQFELLWPYTAGRRISKTRYRIPFKANDIELDLYQGPLAGLIIAEVEFESETLSAAFEKPEWFGKEVTGNIHYLNQHLAVYGLPVPDNEDK